MVETQKWRLLIPETKPFLWRCGEKQRNLCTRQVKHHTVREGEQMKGVNDDMAFCQSIESKFDNTCTLI